METNLSGLQREQLLQEMKKRWLQLQTFPPPSGVLAPSSSRFLDNNSTAVNSLQFPDTVNRPNTLHGFDNLHISNGLHNSDNVHPLNSGPQALPAAHGGRKRPLSAVYTPQYNTAIQAPNIGHYFRGSKPPQSDETSSKPGQDAPNVSAPKRVRTCNSFQALSSSTADIAGPSTLPVPTQATNPSTLSSPPPGDVGSTNGILCYECIPYLCSMPYLLCKLTKSKLRVSEKYQTYRYRLCRARDVTNCHQAPTDLVEDVRRLQELAQGFGQLQTSSDRYDRIVEMRQTHFHLKEEMAGRDALSLCKNERETIPALAGSASNTNPNSAATGSPQPKLTPFTKRIDNLGTMCRLFGLHENNCAEICKFLQQPYIFDTIRRFKSRVCPNAGPLDKLEMNTGYLKIDPIKRLAKKALQGQDRSGCLGQKNGHLRIPGSSVNWHAAHFAVTLVREAQRQQKMWALREDEHDVYETAIRLVGWYYHLFGSQVEERDRKDKTVDPESRNRNFSKRDWLKWFHQQRL